MPKKSSCFGMSEETVKRIREWVALAYWDICPINGYNAPRFLPVDKSYDFWKAQKVISECWFINPHNYSYKML